MTAIVNSTRSSCGLDFHFKTGMVFWSDVTEEAIFSAHIDEGQHRTVVASDGVVTADGLAVDWVHSHLYWTDTGTNAISVCDFTGMSRAVLVEVGLEEPRAIALHPGLGWMFWSDWGRSPRIERAGMDGSHRETIVRESVRWPNGLTIDLVLERLYWVDAKLNTVGSCSLDGSYSRTVLYSPSYLRHPFSISVFEDLMYWTEWDSHRIYEANKFNGANVTTVTTTSLSQLPMVVQVYHPYRQPDFPNHCLPFNGHCSHFCLPAPRLSPSSPTTSCACPSQLRLDEDQRSCLSPQQKELFDLESSKEASATTSPHLKGGSSREAIPLLLLLGTLILLAIAALVAFYRRQWGHKLPVRWPGQGMGSKPNQTREAVRRTILTLSSSNGEGESEGLIIRGPLIDMN